eukprot:GGOE01065476.1.p1 GENE.GGOE01065476.1~~GGOE01065476.1.p1  ORF type:complete len:575 (+),score=171.03 GGOE01065476.1:25-1749(+)
MSRDLVSNKQSSEEFVEDRRLRQEGSSHAWTGGSRPSHKDVCSFYSSGRLGGHDQMRGSKSATKGELSRNVGHRDSWQQKTSSTSTGDAVPPPSPSKLQRTGPTSLQERLVNLSALLVEERQQRAKKRVQLSSHSKSEADTLKGLKEHHHSREMQIKDQEIAALRLEVIQQRQELESLRSASLHQGAAFPGKLDLEVQELLQELQAVKEEMLHREFTEQRTLEEAAQVVMSLELEMETLAAEYDEAQVEMVHLRRMLQKHDAELQSEAQQLSQEVTALTQTVEESQRNAGEKERDLSEAAMHIRRMDEEMAIVRGQLEASRQQQLQAEDQLGAALQRERELRASLEAADAHVAQLEAALQTTATAAEVSHVTRDEAFLRMTQAVEHKSEENAQLVLALREQRRQLDRLQDQMATAALRRNEHDPGRPDLQRVVDTQALLLRQREEEVRAVTRLEAAKDRQLALLQSEVRRLLAGRPITDLYPSLGLLSNTEVRGLPILDEEQRWMATAPMNNLPGIGYLAACPPPTLPSFTADEITSLRSSHSGASGLGRLHDLRCELEEARLKRERLLSAVDL